MYKSRRFTIYDTQYEEGRSVKCTVSATLTPEAYRIYQQWSLERKASANISLAMTESYARENLLAAIKIQRDLYRRRSGAFRFLQEEIGAGFYQTPAEISKAITRIFEKHPFGGDEQLTLEQY